MLVQRYLFDVRHDVFVHHRDECHPVTDRSSLPPFRCFLSNHSSVRQAKNRFNHNAADLATPATANFFLYKNELPSYIRSER